MFDQLEKARMNKPWRKLETVTVPDCNGIISRRNNYLY